MANRQQYTASRNWCLVCGITGNKASWPGLSCHHLIIPGRSDEETNYAVLCAQCHNIVHGGRVRVGGELLPSLSTSSMLAVKEEREPELFDMKRLVALYRGQAASDRGARPLDFAPIPLYYDRLYQRQCPHKRPDEWLRHFGRCVAAWVLEYLPSPFLVGPAVALALQGHARAKVVVVNGMPMAQCLGLFLGADGFRSPWRLEWECGPLTIKPSGQEADRELAGIFSECLFMGRKVA